MNWKLTMLTLCIVCTNKSDPEQLRKIIEDVFEETLQKVYQNVGQKINEGKNQDLKLLFNSLLDEEDTH